MYRIRYYQEVIHPDHFINGGALGLIIRVLNYFRWKLETLVQKLTLRWLAKNGGLPKSRVQELLHGFKLDCAQENLEKEQTSPLRSIEPPPEAVSTQRAERYGMGAFKTTLDAAVTEARGSPPDRPQPMTELIARMTAQGTSRRYIRGRAFQPGHPEGDFEPLDEEKGA